MGVAGSGRFFRKKIVILYTGSTLLILAGEQLCLLYDMLTRRLRRDTAHGFFWRKKVLYIWKPPNHHNMHKGREIESRNKARKNEREYANKALNCLRPLTGPKPALGKARTPPPTPSAATAARRWTGWTGGPGRIFLKLLRAGSGRFFRGGFRAGPDTAEGLRAGPARPGPAQRSIFLD